MRSDGAVGLLGVAKLRSRRVRSHSTQGSRVANAFADAQAVARQGQDMRVLLIILPRMALIAAPP